MIQALRNNQTQAGASWITGAEQQIPESFGNDAVALQAACDRVALYDCSHWGRIRVSGDDRTRFLHNQSTNDIQRLQPGQGCNTVFVTSTGRTIDLVTAYILDDAVLLLTSPNRRHYLLNWMDRFIFFADKVELKDITDSTVAFSLIGPGSEALLTQLGIEAIAHEPIASHRPFQLGEMQGRIGVGSGLAIAGVTLIADVQDAAQLWQTLVDAGAIPMGETAWEQLRIQQGRPMPDAELTEDYNPLEAGLWHDISFSKGCYIGQETIARLDTYKGVKQQLWGVRLTQSANPGEVVMVGDDKVGKLTSLVQTKDGPLGLAYVRTKAGGAGLTVTIGEAKGELMDLPFLTRERSS